MSRSFSSFLRVDKVVSNSVKRKVEVTMVISSSLSVVTCNIMMCTEDLDQFLLCGKADSAEANDQNAADDCCAERRWMHRTMTE